MKNLKNKKGITLVEVIVVLVIMAILAGVLVGVYTGYIDRARNQKETLEVRAAALAANTLYYEDYGNNKITQKDAGDEGYEACSAAGIKVLAGLDGTVSSFTFKNGVLTSLVYVTAASVSWTYTNTNGNITIQKTTP